MELLELAFLDHLLRKLLRDDDTINDAFTEEEIPQLKAIAETFHNWINEELSE